MYLETSSAGPCYCLLVTCICSQRNRFSAAVAAYHGTDIHAIVDTLHEPAATPASQLEVRGRINVVERDSLQPHPACIGLIAHEYLAGEAYIFNVVIALVQRIAIESFIGNQYAVDGLVELLEVCIFAQRLRHGNGLAESCNCARRIATGVGANSIACR